MNAIEVAGLTKRYKDRTAVDHLDLTIAAGECVALLGVNGAGKTTTVKMLAGLTRPTSGDARIFGDSIVRAPSQAKRHIGLSPQETAVAGRLTVRENLTLMARLYGRRKADAVRAADEMLQTFALTERAGDRASKLSGGMQRRLSLAMALISNPDVLFLDEPTLGLDVVARRELWQHITKLMGKTTIILTTHYMEEAQSLADRVCILDHGTIKAAGTVPELLRAANAATLEDAFLFFAETEATA